MYSHTPSEIDLLAIETTKKKYTLDQIFELEEKLELSIASLKKTSDVGAVPWILDGIREFKMELLRQQQDCTKIDETIRQLDSKCTDPTLCKYRQLTIAQYKELPFPELVFAVKHLFGQQPSYKRGRQDQFVFARAKFLGGGRGEAYRYEKIADDDIDSKKELIFEFLEQKQCKYCKKVGHTVYQCETLRSKKCSQCKQSGHSASRCHTMGKDMPRK